MWVITDGFIHASPDEKASPLLYVEVRVNVWERKHSKPSENKA
jgi:hypothetical protein